MRQDRGGNSGSGLEQGYQNKTRSFGRSSILIDTASQGLEAREPQSQLQIGLFLRAQLLLLLGRAPTLTRSPPQLLRLVHRNHRNWVRCGLPCATSRRAKSTVAAWIRRGGGVPRLTKGPTRPTLWRARVTRRDLRQTATFLRTKQWDLVGWEEMLSWAYKLANIWLISRARRRELFATAASAAICASGGISCGGCKGIIRGFGGRATEDLQRSNK